MRKIFRHFVTFHIVELFVRIMNSFALYYCTISEDVKEYKDTYINRINEFVHLITQILHGSNKMVRRLDRSRKNKGNYYTGNLQIL